MIEQPSDDYMFKGKPWSEKILTAIFLIPVLIITLYLIIRITIDPKYRDKLRNPETEIPNPRPDDDATEEEWDTYYREDMRRVEEWHKKHRVSNAILMFIGALLMPIVTFIEWIQRRKEARNKIKHG